MSRGDVAVFRHPTRDLHFVKRIIGLPGDQVQMSEGKLYLNGAPVDMADLSGRIQETLPNTEPFDVLDLLMGTRGDDTPAFDVPDAHVFAMGDNRDNSIDSRFGVEAGGLGMVPLERMIGRVDLVVMSLDGVEGRFMRRVR